MIWKYAGIAENESPANLIYLDKMFLIRIYMSVFTVKPAKSEVVDPELVIGVSTGRNHMESEPVFGYREESMKR